MAHVAIFSTTPLWMVHHAGTIELVLDHLRKKDKVTLVHCNRILQSCPANRWHHDDLCGQCVGESEYSIGKLLPKSELLVHRQLSDFMDETLPRIQPILTRDDLLDYHYKDCPVGRLVASQLMSNFGDLLFELDTKEKVARARTLVSSAVQLYEAAASLVSELEVSATYTWNGRRPSDGPVWWATKAAGRDAFTYVSSGTFGSVYISPESSVQELNTAALEAEMKSKLSGREPDAIREEALLALSDYKESKNRPMDSPDYSRMRSETMLITKPTVTLLLSSAGESYHLASFFHFFTRRPYSWVREAVRILAEELTEFQIVVKWHPLMRNSGQMERAHINEVIDATPIAEHIPPEANIDAYQLVRDSEFTISMGSSVAIWGAANGVPAVVLGPFGRNWGDSVYRVENPNLDESLRSLVRKFPLPPLELSDLYGAVIWSKRLAGREMQFVSSSKRDGVPQVGRRPVSFRAVRPRRAVFDPLYVRFRALIRLVTKLGDRRA